MTHIYLLPLGSADREMIAALCPSLGLAFGASVSMREVVIDFSRFFDERRLQYNSTAIITHLNERFTAFSGPSTDEIAAPRILGVAGEDLFIPILTYVFGEAQLNGRIGVVSYHRLQNERYGLSPDPALTAERLLKEAMHELGHNIGLVHCQLQECVMHISTYAEDIDLKSAAFCDQCQALLASQPVR